MNNKLVTRILIGSVIILIIILFAIIFTIRKRNRQLKQINTMYISIQDSLKVVKNEFNQQTASIQVITSENSKLFTDLTTKDKEIIRLQNIVKVYEKGSSKLNTALVISNETVVNLNDSINNLIISYKAKIDSTGKLTNYPTYSRSFKEKDNWYEGNVKLGIDTFALNIKSRNSYDITIGDEKISLFKRKTFANVTNLSPYTETKVMKVYQNIEVKDHKIRNATLIGGAGVIIGYLIGR